MDRKIRSGVPVLLLSLLPAAALALVCEELPPGCYDCEMSNSSRYGDSYTWQHLPVRGSMFPDTELPWRASYHCQSNITYWALIIANKTAPAPAVEETAWVGCDDYLA